MGLEDFLNDSNSFSITSLKSDQDGIGSTSLETDEHEPSKVEIRPRWDWKDFAEFFILCSDCVEIRPRWDWKPCIKVWV